jgi:polyhydroxybutyrate depolymerase
MKTNFTFLSMLIAVSLLFTGSRDAYAQQPISGSFTSGGNTRHYIGAIPDNPQTPLRVVVLFCGATEDAEQMVLRGFNDYLGDNTLVIYPEPYNTTFGFGNSAGIDDYQMVEDLLDDVAANYTIDTDDICIGGFSNGAVFTYNLVCDFNSTGSTRPYAFKSFAVVSGAMVEGEANTTDCPVANELPVIAFHGTADAIIPYNGGDIGFPLNFTSEATETTVNFWATDVNSCSGNPTVTQLPDINTTDGSTVELLDYPCSASEEVLFYRIIEGPHAWPSGNAPFDLLQGRNLDIVASELIADFFENPNFVSTEDIDPSNISSLISVYPNPVKDYLAIQYSGIIKGIEIYDLTGKRVCSQQLPDHSISLSGIGSGTYFLKIETDSGAAFKMIIKE